MVFPTFFTIPSWIKEGAVITVNVITLCQEMQTWGQAALLKNPAPAGLILFLMRDLAPFIHFKMSLWKAKEAPLLQPLQVKEVH